MLSMRFLAVRDVPRPVPGKNEQECSIEVQLWSIQVQHGVQRRRTRSVELYDAEEKGSISPHAQDSVRASCQTQDCTADPERDSPALWDEELEVQDKEGQETVEIALLFDMAPTTTLGVRRQKFRHSMTTIEMRAFRSHPEERVTLWVPLRPLVPNLGDDFGAIQIAVTYSDDCVAQGYMFGLFCGLAPLSLPSFLSDDIPYMPPNMVDTSPLKRLRSFKSSSPPDGSTPSPPAASVHAADVQIIPAPRAAPVSMGFAANRTGVALAAIGIATHPPCDEMKAGDVDAYPQLPSQCC